MFWNHTGKMNILSLMGSKSDCIFFKLQSPNDKIFKWSIDSSKNLLNNLKLLVNFFLYKKVYKNKS